MKHAKTLIWASLVVLAAMAFLGAGTASASQPKAEPEGGAFPVSFNGSGGEGRLETVPEGEVTNTVTVVCTSSTSVGMFNGPNTFKEITVTFKGCTATVPGAGSLNCGEIKTVASRGTLFYLVAGSSDVGVDLEPEAGMKFSTFTCGGIETLTVKGSVIGKLTPVNTLTKLFTMTFSQKLGRQEPEAYLSPTNCAATRDTLTTEGSGFFLFAPRQSAVSGAENLTTTKAIKIASSHC